MKTSNMEVEEEVPSLTNAWPLAVGKTLLGRQVLLLLLYIPVLKARSFPSRRKTTPMSPAAAAAGAKAPNVMSFEETMDVSDLAAE